MFLALDKNDPDKVAAIDDSGQQLTYGELCRAAAEFAQHLPHRTLIFILAENCNGALIGYLSALNSRVVPLIIGNKTDRVLFDALYEKYQPEYMWLPEERIADFHLKDVVYTAHGYALLKTGFDAPNWCGTAIVTLRQTLKM